MTIQLPSVRVHARGLLLGLALCASSLMTTTAPARDMPIFLGSVGVGKARPELQRELRSLLRAELRAVDFDRVKTVERYVLSANLVRLDSVESPDSVRATCVISVALLHQNGSALYALIHGRATAEEAEMRPVAVESEALRAAVHSAMIRLPNALH